MLNDIRNASMESIAQACGIPSGLMSDGDGSKAREAFRQGVSVGVRPQARLIEDEIRRKLEVDVKLDFSDMRSDDLQGRARAFQSMTKASMPVEKAAALAGLLIED